jgi:hypothetical protein
MWQHIVLLAIRQYERESYRMFVEWLMKAYYFRTFLELSQYIQNHTTLQKFPVRISSTILRKVISSFVLILLSIQHRLLIGIGSSGFKATNASQYYMIKSDYVRNT